MNERPGLSRDLVNVLEALPTALLLRFKLCECQLQPIAYRLSEIARGAQYFVPNSHLSTLAMPRLVHLDPHPLSTRCAHFKGVVLADALPADDKPLAQSVFQARAEVSSEDINLPSDMYTSRSTKCVMFPGQGGWKYSRPYLTTIVTDDQPVKDRIKAETVTLGFTDIAHHGAVDDDSGLLFVGDKHRIKSYSWWDTQEDAPEDPIVPRHTMKSKGFTGAIGLLANGRVARAGPGKVAVWNVDDLPTHYQGSLIGKSIADDDCVADSCRDDYYEIELSRGSKPSSVIQSLEFDVTITRWHPHPDILGTMLSTTSEKRDKHLFCRAIDLEHAGQGTVRYRGHEGPVNQFSTSRGDANIFMTACTDGYARVFDTRSPRPQIKIQAGGWGQNCSAAVLCHPDGIPCRFLTLLL